MKGEARAISVNHQNFSSTCERVYHTMGFADRSMYLRGYDSELPGSDIAFTHVPTKFLVKISFEAQYEVQGLTRTAGEVRCDHSPHTPKRGGECNPPPPSVTQVLT